jgi:hypothetical protein
MEGRPFERFSLGQTKGCMPTDCNPIGAVWPASHDMFSISNISRWKSSSISRTFQESSGTLYGTVGLQCCKIGKPSEGLYEKDLLAGVSPLWMVPFLTEFWPTISENGRHFKHEKRWASPRRHRGHGEMPVGFVQSRESPIVYLPKPWRREGQKAPPCEESPNHGFSPPTRPVSEGSYQSAIRDRGWNSCLPWLRPPRIRQRECTRGSPRRG